MRHLGCVATAGDRGPSPSRMEKGPPLQAPPASTTASQSTRPRSVTTPETWRPLTSTALAAQPVTMRAPARRAAHRPAPSPIAAGLLAGDDPLLAKQGLEPLLCQKIRGAGADDAAAYDDDIGFPGKLIVRLNGIDGYWHRIGILYGHQIEVTGADQHPQPMFFQQTCSSSTDRRREPGDKDRWRAASCIPARSSLPDHAARPLTFRNAPASFA